MKSIYIFLLIILFGIEYSLSGPSVQCYDKATNHYWPAGQEYRPVGQCVTIRCDQRGQRAALTCPISQTSGTGCTKVPADLRRTYPDCCPKYNCAA